MGASDVMAGVFFGRMAHVWIADIIALLLVEQEDLHDPVSGQNI